MTINEFIDSPSERNAHIKHPEFNSLYVRKGAHLIEGVITRTFDVANIEAKEPGAGAFRRFVEHLNLHQCNAIYVECVISSDFREKLLHMGFTESTHISGDYWLKV